MTRRDWWLGIGAIVAGMLLYTLFPRYTCRNVDGIPSLRIDRWTGRIVSSCRLAPTAPVVTDEGQTPDHAVAGSQELHSNAPAEQGAIARVNALAADPSAVHPSVQPARESTVGHVASFDDISAVDALRAVGAREVLPPIHNGEHAPTVYVARSTLQRPETGYQWGVPSSHSGWARSR